MSKSRGFAIAGMLAAVGSLAACGPAGTGTIGVGVDAKGHPVGYLQVCPGAHMDGAFVIAEPHDDSTRAVASWDAKPAATGSTFWSFDRPTSGWVVTRRPAELKPGVVYHLEAGANDGSGFSGYVLFTAEDLKKMKPGQVRIYDSTRPQPAGEATGSLEQQARDENERFMKVVSRQEFDQSPCF
ncbi:hypothetical protein GCM10009740_10920 [Terrabacter terrae]|uniref:Lipoprotein n=1 Tax=Terrabacter terrae TaxID=318434 RepID=A0ABN2TWZ1_9MICO